MQIPCENWNLRNSEGALAVFFPSCKQTMSEEKYSSTWSRQIEAIMFGIFEIFFSQHPKSFQNWRVLLGYSPVFGHVAPLDQSLVL